MKFGTKRRDAGDIGSGNRNYLRNFKTGETKVRFLEEPDEWYLYQEHFTTEGKSFPCTGDSTLCPGCTSEIERVQHRSRKYGTYVYVIAYNATIPYKVGVSLANRLTSRAERNGGTITNRDYVVIRTGEGLKTEYDVDQDEKYTLDIEGLLRKAENGSIEDILQESFAEIWGDPSKYEGRDEYKSHVATKDDVPDALKTPAERSAPPFEPSGMDEFKKDEPEAEVTEIELRAMTRSQLVQLWETAGFDGFDEDWGRAELLDEIIKRAE